jgi:Fe-S-cluster containining protein
MTESWSDIFSRICEDCGGRCCYEAHPPLTNDRIRLIEQDRSWKEALEWKGYQRFRTRDDGYCIMLNHTRCMINGSKPETCRAGPFTFDVEDGKLALYLKKESICPLVRKLKACPPAYHEQYDLAIRELVRLVTALPPEELREILRIEEPETEKVAEISLS